MTGLSDRGFFVRVWCAARGNWGALLVVAGLFAVGLVSNRPSMAASRVPLPPGWTVAAETGVTLGLAIDGDTVWAGGKSGLFRVDRKTGACLGKVDVGVPALHVRSLAIDSDGALWIGHVDGLIRLANGLPERFGEKDGLPNKRVNGLLATDGRIYIGTGAGLVVFEGGKLRDIGLTEKLASPVVSALFRSADGAVWVGSNSDPSGGISRVLGGRVDVMRVREGLPHPYVQDFAEPVPGEICVATGQFDKGGAVLISPSSGPLRPRLTLRKDDGLAGEKVRSLGVDSSGDVWLGSESDGLAIWRKTSDGAGRGSDMALITTNDGLPHNEITAIQRDVDGNMWLATLAGVVRIRADAAQAVGSPVPKASLESSTSGKEKT